jgi:hypothetical protein
MIKYHFWKSIHIIHWTEIVLQLTSYEPTPWMGVPEKLIITPKFPAFYGTQRFITVFTRAHQWTVSEPDESSLHHQMQLL